MEIITWVIFGLIVGAIANWVAPGRSPGGVVGSIVVGMLGALVGGWLGQLLFGVDVSGFNLSSFLVAVAGALLVIFAYKMFTRA